MPADVRPARPLALTPRVKVPPVLLARMLAARLTRRPVLGSRVLGSRVVRRLAPVTPVLAGAVLAATVAAGLSGCGTRQPGGNIIAVSAGACGTGWRQVSAGMQIFQIRNSFTGGAEVDLINPASGAIYAEVAGLGPGTTRPMRVDLGSGRYAFRCLLQDTDPLTGPAVRIGGHHRGAPAILPVTTDDLLGPARVYHAYVSAGLNMLVRQVGVLTQRIRAGHLRAAQAAWLPAHLTYERLGAAYGTFGNYDTEIDGRPDGLPRGLSDPAFTGFYRIEYGLWHGQSARQLGGLAARLDNHVRALRRFWPGMEINLLDLGLRDPRDPGERAAVPAHRARRLRQRDDARHGRGERRRDQGAAGRAASAAGRALPGAGRGIRGAGHAGPPAHGRARTAAAAGRPCASCLLTGASSSTRPPGRSCRNSLRSRP